MDRLKKFMLVCLMLVPTLSSFGQFKLYEKGHDSYTAGKYDEAIQLFSEYLTKTTRDKNLDVEVFYLRGLSYFKKSDYKNAIGDFEECLLRNHTNKGNIHWFKAKCHVNEGVLPDAIDNYTSAIAVLGGDNAIKAKLLLERGVLYKKSSNLDLAIDDFQEGLRILPASKDFKKELDEIDPKYVASRSALRNQSTTSQPANTTPTQNNQSDAKLASNQPDKKQSDTRNDKTEKKQPGTGNSTNPVVEKDAVAKNQQTDQSSDPKKKPKSIFDRADRADNDVKKDAGTQTPPVTGASITTATEAKAPTLADQYKDEKRYALIIGNSTYPKAIGVLKNPVNDATDLAKELQASNFDVQLLLNATYGQMRAAMLKFKEKIDAGDKDKTVSLFYFAGHGVQYEDENFLVPVDAMIEYQDDISRYCFGVQKMVLANMERSNSRMNIVILDACRNNPFPALTRSLGNQGLGEMRRARGSFIAYATAPGSVASDGTGRNGLYTQELLKAMRKPGLTIEQVFKEVRANVLKLSNDKQNTWDSSNIIGEFYFKF
jgi:tetratricopeptide (TPR) repeat protein